MPDDKNTPPNQSVESNIQTPDITKGAPVTKTPQTDNFDEIKSQKGKHHRKNKDLWQLSEVRPERPTQYGRGIFKKLGGIIKAISFVVSFFVFAVMLVIGFVLYKVDVFFKPFAIAIVIFGAVVALIIMFLIYGLGQVISQNNEILRRLEHKGYH